MASANSQDSGEYDLKASSLKSRSSTLLVDYGPYVPTCAHREHHLLVLCFTTCSLVDAGVEYRRVRVSAMGLALLLLRWSQRDHLV